MKAGNVGYLEVEHEVIKEYKPPERVAYTSQEARVEAWKSLWPSREDYKSASEFRIAVAQHYTQFPTPYGHDVLARDYSHVGKKKLCAFGSPGAGPMQLNEPHGLTTTQRESVLVCDSVNNRIVEWMVHRREGNMVKKIGSKGQAPGEFRQPLGIAVNHRTGDIAIADSVNSRIQVFNADGSIRMTFGEPGKKQGQLRTPSGVAFTSEDHIVVCDEGNHRIQVFTFSGNFVFAFGKRGNQEGEFQFPCAVAVHLAADIFAVCDKGNHRVQFFAYDGVFLKSVGGKGTAPTKFCDPSGVAFNAHGDLIVSDGKNRRVQVFWASGGLCTIFGNTDPERDGDWFKEPGAVAFDDKLLLVADTRRMEVSVFRPAQHVECGSLAQLPREFIDDCFRMLHYNDANNNDGLGRNSGVVCVNRFFLQMCRRMRMNWDLRPLEPGLKAASKLVLGRKVKVAATELEKVKELWETWGVGTDRELQIIQKGVMRFNEGFRSAFQSLYGAKYWYTYQNLLQLLFNFYAKKYSMQFSRDNPLAPVLGKKEFLLLLTFDKEVQLGLKTWHGHPATTGRYARLPLLGTSMSAFDFRETVIAHQQSLLVPRTDKPLRNDPGILLAAGAGGYHMLPPANKDQLALLKTQTKELRNKKPMVEDIS